MFILNKKSNMIMECINEDVVEVCKKDAKNYAVASTKEELLALKEEQITQSAQEGAEKEVAEELEAETAKNEPEPNQEASDGIEEAMNTPEEAEGDLTEDDLLAKTVKELREIAKECGIQGYANMNKDTLVQMILNH